MAAADTWVVTRRREGSLQWYVGTQGGGQPIVWGDSQAEAQEFEGLDTAEAVARRAGGNVALRPAAARQAIHRTATLAKALAEARWLLADLLVGWDQGGREVSEEYMARVRAYMAAPEPR